MKTNRSQWRLYCGLAAAIVCTVPAFGDWVYSYQDDFSTDKLKNDSYSHSVVWPEMAFPPAEPYLTFTQFTKNPPSLIFRGYLGGPAHLNYCFPLEADSHPRRIKGTLEFDILPQPYWSMPEPLGYLSYSLSGDGHIWTIPTVLGEGHHRIAIGSEQGTCYVAFRGTFGVLDNLEIHLTAEAALIRVPQDYPTIQAGIDAAKPGDVVEVSPGTYRGDGNWNIELRGKAITVRGEKGAEQTIIDCQGLDQGPGKLDNRGFYVHQGEGSETVIQGFTIQNGILSGQGNLYETVPHSDSKSNPVGGGIYCENAGPTIAHCVIRDCGTEFGGGIGCVNGTPTILHCRITECKSGGFGGPKSGGFGSGIALLRRSNATIGDCTIINNHGYNNGFGSGIYVRASTARILACDIQGNDADGGLKGGGIAVGGPYSKVEMANCRIVSNIAQIGSGIWIDGRHDNYTGGLTGPVCEVMCTNCTVFNNGLTETTPPFPAGGIYSTTADIRIRNTIVWKNGGQEIQLIDPASNSPVTYSDVEGGYIGSGNMALDPLFASSTDTHLQSVIGRFDPATGSWIVDSKHSPCIDAGDPRDAFDLEPTPNGRRINMGAYGQTIEASKGKRHLVYHVDGSTGNDSHDGLSHETAFKTIMKGIYAGQNGDTVLVWPGVYTGPILFYGKAITLASAADAAILQAPNDYAISMHSGEGPQSIVKNFVIRGSMGGVFIVGGNPTLMNLTIVQNTHGVLAYEGANPDISHCIFWFNSGSDLFDCKARYSCIEDNVDWPSMEGNIHTNPLFADPKQNDFHLQSQRGRYWPKSGNAGGVWILDEATSPCIDAGDPRIRPTRERMPNGGRINIGAYGGTPFAGMSEWPLSHDTNRDGVVNLSDFADLAEQWLRSFPWSGPLPSVHIIQPESGTSISLGQGRFDVLAEVVNPIDEIARFEFYADGILVCVDYNGSSGWTCNTLFRTIGVHQICARAIDVTGRILDADCAELRIVE